MTPQAVRRLGLLRKILWRNQNYSGQRPAARYTYNK